MERTQLGEGKEGGEGGTGKWICASVEGMSSSWFSPEIKDQIEKDNLSHNWNTVRCASIWMTLVSLRGFFLPSMHRYIDHRRTIRIEITTYAILKELHIIQSMEIVSAKAHWSCKDHAKAGIFSWKMIWKKNNNEIVWYLTQNTTLSLVHSPIQPLIVPFTLVSIESLELSIHSSF